MFLSATLAPLQTSIIFDARVNCVQRRLAVPAYSAPGSPLASTGTMFDTILSLSCFPSALSLLALDEGRRETAEFLSLR